MSGGNVGAIVVVVNHHLLELGLTQEEVAWQAPELVGPQTDRL